MNGVDPSNVAKLHTITIGAVSSQAAAGLAWSGLPHFAAEQMGDPRLYSLFFIVSSIATLGAPIIGGLVPQRISDIKIAVGSSCIASSLYLIIGLVPAAMSQNVLPWLLFIGSVVGAFSGPAVMHMRSSIQKNAYKGDIEAGSAHFNTFVMIAKMVGFSLGPIVFGHWGVTALYIIAGGFFLEVVTLLWLGRFSLPKSQSSESPVGTRLADMYRLMFKYPVAIRLAVLNGALTFPVITYCLITLAEKPEALPEHVALFWTCSSIFSVITNYIISKGLIRRIGRPISFMFGNVLIAGAVACVYFALTPFQVIVAFCLFTIGNPIIGAISRKVFFDGVNIEERRIFFGLVQSISAIGSLITLIAVNSLGDDRAIYMIVSLIILVVLRQLDQAYRAISADSTKNVPPMKAM